MLLIWLLIAPAATKLLSQSGQDLVVQTSETTVSWKAKDFYEQGVANISLQDLLEPTRILLSAFVLVFLLEGLIKRNRPILLDKTEIWMSVFSLILLANVLLRSGRIVFGLHTAVDAFIIPFLTYYVARRLVTSEERFRQLTRTIGYMGLYVIVICLIERLTISELFYRLRGPFALRDVLYVVMEVVFFTVLLDLFSNRYVSEGKHILPRTVQWFVILMAPLVILLTITRGNWASFLAGGLVFAFLSRKLISPQRKMGSIGMGMILCALIVIALSVVVPDEFVEIRVTDTKNVLGRLATWTSLLELASEGPIFGIGLNNLHALLTEEILSLGNFRNLTTPHNSFLSLLIELGPIGLLAYLGIIASIMQKGFGLYRKANNSHDAWRGLTVIAIMVAYQMPSLFANTFYIVGLIHVYPYAFMGAIAGLYGQYSLRLNRSAAHLHQLQINGEIPTITR